MTTKRITLRERIRKLEAGAENLTLTLQGVESDIAALNAAIGIKAERLGTLSQAGARTHESAPLPESLRTTLGVLSAHGKNGLTAQDVSKWTRRSRCLESTYLNKLALLGYLERLRAGPNVIYRALLPTYRRR